MPLSQTTILLLATIIATFFPDRYSSIMGNEQSVVNFQKDLEIVQDKLVKAETNAMHEGFTWPFMDYDLLVHGAPVHFDPGWTLL